MTRKATKKRAVKKSSPRKKPNTWQQKIPTTLCGVAMQPYEWAVLVGVMLGAMWLRFWNLSEWAVGGDDAIHVLLSQRQSLLETLTHITKYETHPSFKYLILYLLTKYVSPSQDLIRLIGAIPGTLLMPAMYLLGRIMIGRTGGLVLLLATALSPTAIIQSENVRAYSLCQVALVVALAAAWHYMKAPSTRKLSLYFGMMALAIVNQYGAVLPAMGMGAALLLIVWQQKRRITQRMYYIAGGHVLLFALWAIQVGVYTHFRDFTPADIGYVQRGFITDISSFGRVLGLVTSGFLMVGPNPLYYPFMALFVAGGVLMWRDREYRILICLGFVLALAIFAALVKKYPMIEIRQGWWLMIFTYLPLAYLAERAMQRAPRLVLGPQLLNGLIALLALSNALFFDIRFLSPDFYRLGAYYYGVFAEQEVRHKDFIGAMQFLEARIQPGPDVVIMGLADGLRMHYYNEIYRNPPLKKMLPARLQCRSWHNYSAMQLKDCLYRLWEVSPDPRKSEKEVLQDIERLRRSREVYILTGHKNDLMASKRFIDWSKPAYFTPTLAVFAASSELRGLFRNPPPNRPVPPPPM